MHARPARRRWRTVISAVARPVVLLALIAGQAGAQRLEKPVEDWLKQHRLLVTADEQKVLQQLKAADLDEFTRIFWARRSPAAVSAENAYRAAVEKSRGQADARFGDVGRRGSQTACGQVLMLLGNPDEVTGRELRNIFDTRPQADSRYRRPEAASSNATRDGARRPELWTYKSRPERTFRMPGGDLKLQFDDGCEFEESVRTMDELARVAGEQVRHRELEYEFDAGGRLKPMAAAAPAAPLARRLLDQPRNDFVLVFEPTIQAPGERGAYTAGILRGEAGALNAAAHSAPARLRVVARATPSSGSSVDAEEKDGFAVVRPDGSFLTSFGLTLPPGRYRVSIAGLEPVSGRGGVATAEIEAPDYSAKALVVSPLAVLSGEATGTGVPAPNDPMAALAIGALRLGARPGNVLSQWESLQLLVLVHNAPLNAATGRAAVKASFSVLKDGQVIAKGKDQQFDTAGSAPTVGPIPLAPFAPGRYLARAEITEAVGKAQVVRETPFEVAPQSNPPRPAMPAITAPVMFDTPEADRILAALQVFPPDNAWNQDISALPVHRDSASMIAGIGADKPLRYNLDMGFIIVPPTQPRVPVKLLDYPAESDPGPYPVPDNAPIENWPLQTNEDAKALPKPGQTLEQLQREGTGDRHIIVVDPVNGKLYEFWQSRKTDAGWEASNNATFDLRTGALRPERWTSADAAGLPIFPAVVRYDECERGMVEHAMRFTVRRTRRAYVLPATHWASALTDPTLPRMGERFRLRKDFDVSAFPPHAQAILKGLKKYGMFVADNGSDWFMSIAPDRRLKGLETLTRLKGSDFEVVETGARSVEGK